MLVMWMHMGYLMRDTPYYVLFQLPGYLFFTPSSVFFVLAGYFVCRDITWKKALYNAWWCFAPFVLWGVIHLTVTEGFHSTWLYYCVRITGINNLCGWQLFGNVPMGPANGPLWFMRDLCLLFLVSPIIYKYAKVLFLILVMLSLSPLTSAYFHHDDQVTCSIYSISYFTAGCFLRTLTKEHQKKLLEYCSPFLLSLYILCRLIPGTVDYIQNGTIPDSSDSSLVSSSYVTFLVASVMLYQLARLIELKLPWFTPIALKLAPVTFLTFAAHFTIMSFLFEEESVHNVLFCAVLPFIIFFVMFLCFLFFKRWCRPLLHLVAHYKLRPDD